MLILKTAYEWLKEHAQDLGREPHQPELTSSWFCRDTGRQIELHFVYHTLVEGGKFSGWGMVIYPRCDDLCRDRLPVPDDYSPISTDELIAVPLLPSRRRSA